MHERPQTTRSTCCMQANTVEPRALARIVDERVLERKMANAIAEHVQVDVQGAAAKRKRVPGPRQENASAEMRPVPAPAELQPMQADWQTLMLQCDEKMEDMQVSPVGCAKKARTASVASVEPGAEISETASVEPGGKKYEQRIFEWPRHSRHINRCRLDEVCEWIYVVGKAAAISKRAVRASYASKSFPFFKEGTLQTRVRSSWCPQRHAFRRIVIFSPLFFQYIQTLTHTLIPN